MTNEEILQGLFDDTLVGNAPSVKALTEEGLAAGMDPETLLYDALIPSLEEVGARFGQRLHRRGIADQRVVEQPLQDLFVGHAAPRFAL